ncbi:tail fiber assembly protein [Kosakonia sacchari]|uniref:Tail fiber assembly protein n=1 Tax=Kosakonia sacchari TaxID=1158459 RepID=A0ABZ0MSN1_9ENTR|nr:tail fiber assembly protein [Kosakonia sacchari]WOZ78522.1 tail fiber assembly protein [Kosakonia sacchari]
MAIFYSNTTKGFYLDEMRDSYDSVKTWPDDAKEISDALYKSLMDGQASGKVIASDDDGAPVLITPKIDWNARAESQRQKLLTEASNVTADWRTELQLDVISADDKASLIKWMAYIQKLKSIDLTNVAGSTNDSTAPDISWPEKPQ